jgi:hypothetical protein
MGDARLMRILFGDRRQYRDLPARSARAKAMIERTRPWSFACCRRAWLSPEA